MALYLLSDVAKAPSIGLLLAGGISAIIGVWIKSSSKPKEEPVKSQRFQGLKKLKNRTGGIEKKEKKSKREKKTDQQAQEEENNQSEGS